MDINALYNCISDALNDENVVVIEIHGLKHIFSLTPKKVAYVMIKYDSLWVVKTAHKSIATEATVSQLLINPDQVVYVNVVKKEG